MRTKHQSTATRKIISSTKKSTRPSQPREREETVSSNQRNAGHYAAGFGAVELVRAHRARYLRKLQLPRNSPADFRGDVALRALRGRRDGHRLEGNVHICGPVELRGG